MLNEVVAMFREHGVTRFIDGTLGGAGHSSALLETLPGACMLGIDQDPTALEAAGERLTPFGNRAILARGNFSDMEAIAEQHEFHDVDGVLLDIGVSSPQIDTPERGFSLRFDGPLDMRMDPDATLTAAFILNNFSEIVSLFGLSDECTGNDISLVSTARTFKAGIQSKHCPDTVVVAYTVTDPYGNDTTFYHAQLIQDTIAPTFHIVPTDTSLCVDSDGDYVATVKRVAATIRTVGILDNCTKGSFVVDTLISFDPQSYTNPNGYVIDEDFGTRTYSQVWSVTDSCGNTRSDTLDNIHLYMLPTIHIDSLDTQTITYGETIKEVEIHHQYSNLSVLGIDGSDGISLNNNTLHGQPSAAGTYVYYPTATSWYDCNTVETTVTFIVNPRPITFIAASAIKKYDGQPLTLNSYSCMLTSPYFDPYNHIMIGNDSIASVTITGSQTNVGISQNVPSDASITIATETTADKNPSYAISYANGTLEVITNDTLIRVIPGSGSKIYDGTPFTLTDHDDFTVTGVPDGLTWEATADGTVTNVIPGEGEKAVNAVTSFHIFDANHVDVTEYFTNIKTATGKLTVKQGLTAGPGKTGEYWATLYHQAYGYEVDENTNIYIASLSGTVLTLTKMDTDRRIPGDNAVVLKSNSSPIALTVFPTVTSYNDFAGNDLQGVPFLYQNGIYSADPQGLVANGTQYVLSGGSHGAGFYKMASGYSIPSGKAYLVYTGLNTAPDCFRLEDGEEISTGLILIPAADADDRWPGGTKGSNAGRKFILNGRLYILRGGIIYDIFGNRVESYETHESH